MKWFGRKAGREESRPALSRGGYVSALGDWAQGYEQQVRAAYLGNPVAQRAVKLVCEGVGSAPLLASDPALAALVQARSGGQLLTETVAAQLLLHGNAYVQIAADSAGRVVPVTAITAVAAMPVAGDPVALAADGYAIDLDAEGQGWRRCWTWG